MLNQLYIGVTEVHHTDKRIRDDERKSKIHSNTLVAYGLEDIDDKTGFLRPGCDWIQCSDKECRVLGYTKSLEEAAGGQICSLY